MSDKAGLEGGGRAGTKAEAEREAPNLPPHTDGDKVARVYACARGKGWHPRIPPGGFSC